MELLATIARFSTPGSATSNLNKVLKKVKAVGIATPDASKKGSARKRKTGKPFSIFMAAALTDQISHRGR